MRIKSTQDLAAGALLIGFGLLGRSLISHLPMGTPTRMGAAYLPTVVSWLIVGIGAVLVIRSFFVAGEQLKAVDARALGLVLGAFCLFGILIEGGGMIAASLALILVSGFADRQHRWKEAVIFGVVLTAFAVIVFKILLGLPMPLVPRWI
jgi:uncharacterized BrkB/YihY/UPF0761 family membrane protein